MNVYFIYIVTNLHKTVLYIGVTNNLARRLKEHYDGAACGGKSFTARYQVYNLLYYETFQSIRQAIDREKQLKGWSRSKKMALIKELNPSLEFLEL